MENKQVNVKFLANLNKIDSKIHPNQEFETNWGGMEEFSPGN